MDKCISVILNKLPKKDTETLPLSGISNLGWLKSGCYLKQIIFNIVCEAAPEIMFTL